MVISRLDNGYRTAPTLHDNSFRASSLAREPLRRDVCCLQVSNLCYLPCVVLFASQRLANSTCRVADAYKQNTHLDRHWSSSSPRYIIHP